jgi:hypothetical protein
MNNTDLTAQQSFEEKLVDRIRKDIGELMPDAVLEEIVGKATHKVFFESKVVRDRYGSMDREEAPVMAVVRDLLDKRVAECVREWIADNEDKVLDTIGDLVAGGIVASVARSINSLFSQPMWELDQKIRDVVESLAAR